MSGVGGHQLQKEGKKDGRKGGNGNGRMWNVPVCVCVYVYIWSVGCVSERTGRF